MKDENTFKEQMRILRQSSELSEGLASYLVGMLMSLLPHMVPEDSYGPGRPLMCERPKMGSSEVLVSLPELGEYKITVEKKNEQG